MLLISRISISLLVWKYTYVWICSQSNSKEIRHNTLNHLVYEIYVFVKLKYIHIALYFDQLKPISLYIIHVIEKKIVLQANYILSKIMQNSHKQIFIRSKTDKFSNSINSFWLVYAPTVTNISAFNENKT